MTQASVSDGFHVKAFDIASSTTVDVSWLSGSNGGPLANATTVAAIAKGPGEPPSRNGSDEAAPQSNVKIVQLVPLPSP